MMAEHTRPSMEGELFPPELLDPSRRTAVGPGVAWEKGSRALGVHSVGRGVATHAGGDHGRVVLATPTPAPCRPRGGGVSRRRTSGPRSRTRLAMLQRTSRVGSEAQLDLFSRVLLEPLMELEGSLPLAQQRLEEPGHRPQPAPAATDAVPCRHAPAALRDGVFLLSVVVLIALAWFGA